MKTQNLVLRLVSRLNIWVKTKRGKSLVVHEDKTITFTRFSVSPFYFNSMYLCLCYQETACMTSSAGSAHTYRSVFKPGVHHALCGVCVSYRGGFSVQVNGKSLSLKQFMEEPTLSLVSENMFLTDQSPFVDDSKILTFKKKKKKHLV